MEAIVRESSFLTETTSRTLLPTGVTKLGMSKVLPFALECAALPLLSGTTWAYSGWAKMVAASRALNSTDFVFVFIVFELSLGLEPSGTQHYSSWPPWGRVLQTGKLFTILNA